MILKSIYLLYLIESMAKDNKVSESEDSGNVNFEILESKSLSLDFSWASSVIEDMSKDVEILRILILVQLDFHAKKFLPNSNYC